MARVRFSQFPPFYGLKNESVTHPVFSKRYLLYTVQYFNVGCTNHRGTCYTKVQVSSLPVFPTPS